MEVVAVAVATGFAAVSAVVAGGAVVASRLRRKRSFSEPRGQRSGGQSQVRAAGGDTGGTIGEMTLALARPDACTSRAASWQAGRGASLTKAAKFDEDEVRETQEVLAACHGVLRQTCPLLKRRGCPNYFGEVGQHLPRITWLGQRISLDPSVIAAVTAAAQKRSHDRSNMDATAFDILERRVGTASQHLEQRLQYLLAKSQSLSFEVAKANAVLETCQGAHFRGFEASLARRRLAPRPALIPPPALTDVPATCADVPFSDKRGTARMAKGHSFLHPSRSSPAQDRRRAAAAPPVFHKFWEDSEEPDQDDRKPKRARREAPEHLVEADSKEGQVQASLLTIFNDGDDQALQIVQGLKKGDVHKILAHRKQHGPLSTLACLKDILGRNISIQRLLVDNS